jgi:cyclic-di-GMP-binding protein
LLVGLAFGSTPPCIFLIENPCPAPGEPSAVADNHAFDIVSEVNTAEMHNAVVQAQHEIAVRYDFKGTKASIEYDKKENKVTLHANDKGQLETVIQMLKEKMAKRGVSVKALKRGKVEEATHESVREVITLHVGIETDDAKKIVKQIKGMGIKVQSQIMDSKVRVTGKKLDELQEVIKYLKENGPEYPLQFNNFT